MTIRGAWNAGAAGLAGVGMLLAAGESPAAAADVPPSASAAAVSSTGQSREQVNPGQQVEPTRRRRPIDVFSGPAKEACQLSDDPSLAFDFHQGVIDDPSRILSDREKQSAWGGALGRRITPHELCEIRDRLALAIFRRGILARVIIPPQTIAGGVVKFRVIAAKIVSVRFDGDDIGPAQGKVEAYLNHLRRRDIFDLDSAQRWLLLVNDIPGVQATAKVVHSTAPGAPAEGLDLVVTVRRVPVDEFGEIANTNAKTLGPWNGIARVDINSLTPLGERTSLIAYTTLGDERQEVAQVIEAVKVGDSGLFAQASFSYGHSRPGNVLAPLDLTGNSYVGSIELDYPLIRLQRQTVILAAGMDFVDQTTTIPSATVANDALRVLWGRADTSFSASDRPFMDDLVSTAADLSLQVRKGLEVLGASEAGAQDLSRPGGQADAWVLRAESHAAVTLAPTEVKFLPVTISAHFIGQWADRPLLAYEQQAIGNLTIGRGYDPNVVSGDRVAAGEVKIELGPIRLSRRASMTPYLFDDLARVDYVGSISQSNVTLRSLGGGLAFRIPYDRRGDAVRIDAGFAKPLDRPILTDPKKPPEEFLLEVVFSH